MKKNKFSKAIKHLKSTEIDEKIQRLDEAPTNRISGLYSLNPPGMRLSGRDPERVFYPDADGNWPAGIPGVPGETKYIRPAGYWDEGPGTAPPVEWEVLYDADFSYDTQTENPRNTETIIDKDTGFVKSELPPNSRSFILGPIVDSYIHVHGYDNITRVGYIQKDTREFVLLGYIDGTWGNDNDGNKIRADGYEQGNTARIWDGLESSFTAVNQNFTFAMLQWFHDKLKIGAYTQNVAYYLSGGIGCCVGCGGPNQPPGAVGGNGPGGPPPPGGPGNVGSGGGAGGNPGSGGPPTHGGPPTQNPPPTDGEPQDEPKKGGPPEAGFPWPTPRKKKKRGQGGRPGGSSGNRPGYGGDDEPSGTPPPETGEPEGQEPGTKRGQGGRPGGSSGNRPGYERPGVPKRGEPKPPGPKRPPRGQNPAPRPGPRPTPRPSPTPRPPTPPGQRPPRGQNPAPRPGPRPTPSPKPTPRPPTPPGQRPPRGQNPAPRPGPRPTPKPGIPPNPRTNTGQRTGQPPRPGRTPSNRSGLTPGAPQPTPTQPVPQPTPQPIPTPDIPQTNPILKALETISKATPVGAIANAIAKGFEQLAIGDYGGKIAQSMAKGEPLNIPQSQIPQRDINDMVNSIDQAFKIGGEYYKNTPIVPTPQPYSDDNFYEGPNGEIIAHTPESLQQFPPNTKEMPDGGNIIPGKGLGRDRLAKAGQAQTQIVVPEDGSEPYLKYTDHAYVNFGSKDTGEFPTPIHAGIANAMSGIHGPNAFTRYGYPPNIMGDVRKEIQVPYSKLPSNIQERIRQSGYVPPTPEKSKQGGFGKIEKNSTSRSEFIQRMVDQHIDRENAKRGFKESLQRRKRILREIKQPYVLPEAATPKPMKMNFKGKFSAQNMPSVTASKQSDDMVRSKNAAGQTWRTKDKYWGGYESTERMNVVYDRSGHGEYAFEMISNRNKEARMMQERKLQEHLNTIAHDSAMRKMDSNYESPFRTIKEEETPENPVDTVQPSKFKKVTSKLRGDYSDKPAKKGYPNEPPQKQINGYHPDLVTGQKVASRFNRLDPVSARATPKTAYPEIDKKVQQAKKKPK